MSSEQFAKYPAEEPDRDQKGPIYCYGIQEGSDDQWDQLFEQYLTESNANELSDIRVGLSCSKSEDKARVT